MISLIRATISAVVDLTGVSKLFSAAGRVGEIFTNRELWQHYGFSSSPLPGAKGLCIAHGNQVVMIADGDVRYRVTLLPGEVALYDAYGNEVRLSNGEIAINAAGDITVVASGAVSVTADSVAVTGDLGVTGNILATGTVHGSNV